MSSTCMDSGIASLQNYARFIAKFIKVGAKILEVGSGTGDLMNLLQNSGYRTEGIELDKNVRESANKNFGFSFHFSIYEDRNNEKLSM